MKINTITTPTNSTLRSATWYDGKLLVCGGQGFNTSVVLEYDTLNKQVVNRPLPAEINKELFSMARFRSHWISGGEGGLAVIGNANITPWQQPEYQRIHKILTDNDFFYLLMNFPEGSKILKYDSTFNLTKTFTFSHDALDIAIRDGKLVLCGTGYIATLFDDRVEYSDIKGDVFVQLAKLDNKWYALGLKGKLYESKDNAQSWKPIHSIPGHCNRIIPHENRKTLFIVGDGARCYEYEIESHRLVSISGLGNRNIKNACVLNASSYMLLGEQGAMCRIDF